MLWHCAAAKLVSRLRRRREICFWQCCSFSQTCLVRGHFVPCRCVAKSEGNRSKRGTVSIWSARACGGEKALFACATSEFRMLCARAAAKLVSRLRRRREFCMSKCSYFSQTCLVRGHFMRRLRVSESEGNRSRAHSGGIWSACTRGCEKALFACSTSEFRMLWHCVAAK